MEASTHRRAVRRGLDRRWTSAAIAALVLLAGTAAPPGGVASAADGPAHGLYLHLSVPAPSLHEKEHSVRVYLPPSYARGDTAGRRYPVIFLLHGWPGGDGNWPGQGRAITTLDSMIANGSIPELIALMPNANGGGTLGRSMYLNAWDGSFPIQDFLTRDLVAWVDRTYPTRPDPRHRALIGLSEGGGAAVNLSFKHPDVFGACASSSGEFVLKRSFGIGKLLGPEPGASRILEENSPPLYAERVAPALHSLVIYLDCGLEDEELADNRALHAKLESLGVPHAYHEFPGGHGWGYWRVHLRDALLVVTAHMR